MEGKESGVREQREDKQEENIVVKKILMGLGILGN